MTAGEEEGSRGKVVDGDSMGGTGENLRSLALSNDLIHRSQLPRILHRNMLTPPRVPLQILPRRPLDRRQICMQIHDAPSPTRSDRRVRPALVLLVIDVHLLHVFLVSLVLVFVMGADDGGSEPNDWAELHGCVV